MHPNFNANCSSILLCYSPAFVAHEADGLALLLPAPLMGSKS
jgi:hypothetical protein